MVEYTDKDSLIQAIKTHFNLSQSSKKIGFVPTMGALHQGHTSLIRQAMEENDIVVVSIFVNPTQFNNLEDLKKYPRTPEKDLEIIKNIDENVLVYRPAVDDLYDRKVISNHYDFGGLENEMEGKHRKGHFDGVGTIVSKLFKIVKPDKAYFGEKDFQQLQIIKKLVSIEKLPIEIVGCPIIREENGLAMSSRNTRLTDKEKYEAALIYQTLKEVKKNFKTDSIKDLYNFVSEQFLSHDFLQLEYFVIADEETLKEVYDKNAAKHRAFIAVFIGNIRLVDNIVLY